MIKYLNFYTKNELAHILFPEYPGRYAWKKLAAMLSDEPGLAPLLQSKRRYISIRERVSRSSRAAASFSSSSR